MNLKQAALVLATLMLGLTATTLSAEESLAKQSQNPVASLISVPIEFWHYEAKDADASANALVAKPVYPVQIGKVNLINRFIIPYVGLDANFNADIPDFGPVSTSVSGSGLGDIQYQGFLSPANPGKVIWGVGPVFQFPTHSNNQLGSNKFSAGVATIVLSMPGKWVLGVLAQNLWSVAGDSQAADVNEFLFQYFINFNLSNGWYLTTSPTLTANWEASSSDRWSIPWGGGVGRLVKFGNQPVDFKLQAYTYSEGSIDNSAMFAVKFLFPK
jgi:hypothetical protein